MTAYDIADDLSSDCAVDVAADLGGEDMLFAIANDFSGASAASLVARSGVAAAHDTTGGSATGTIS